MEKKTATTTKPAKEVKGQPTTKGQNGDSHPPQESASAIAKKIKTSAKQSDQYEYEDADFAQEIFDLLPEGEFVLKTGNMNVIQKL